MISSLDLYQRSPKKSLKLDTYFPVYDELFAKYRDKAPTVIEVGILSGGSLFMWREFFGPDARIIGVEMNPQAQKWEADGFEIFIGDQSSPAFWQEVFSKVGDIDVLIDDGGHANYHQMATLFCALPHVKDGGMVVIEDTHTSYMKNYGNPSRWSFMTFCGAALHKINDRYFQKDALNPIRDCVHSIESFESLVAFKVNRGLCIKPTVLNNGGEDDFAKDYYVERDKAGPLVQAFPRLAKRARRYKNRYQEKMLSRKIWNTYL